MNLTLTANDFLSLSPILILLVGALLILLLESFFESASKKYSFWLAAISGFTALYAAVLAPASTSPLLTPWLKFDALTRLFTVSFIGIGLASTFLASVFFKRFAAPPRGEYYFLLLSAVIGSILIGLSADFLTLFIGLETLSISLYVLVGYMKTWELSHESAIKYFLMGAIGAAIFLYGIAFIYGAIGTTNLGLLQEGYKGLSHSAEKLLFLSGIALITVGLAFKAAVVPFHVWAPDTYDGAPTPVTGFMAVGTKAAAFIALAVIFLVNLPNFNPVWNQLVSYLAYPTLIYANFVAMRQTQLRRFFAYSGISHAGFLLIPLAAGGPEALSALLFYLAVYSIATLGCFAVLSFLDDDSEGPTLEDLRGLYKKSPWLSALFAFFLLTLAGIPPTIGFFAKFYIFKVAFQAGYYGLVIVGLLTTLLSAYYYLRIISFMLVQEPREKKLNMGWQGVLIGGLSFVSILFLSFYPAPFQSIIQVVSGAF